MIFNPPDKKNGALNSTGMLKSSPVSAGEMDAPTERAMAVTPDAAERSSGATTAIVYDWRVGTSIWEMLNRRRRTPFAWYNLVGSFATATGALAGGWLAQILQSNEWPALEAYRVVLAGYALGGLILLLLFLNLTKSVEVKAIHDGTKRVLGLHRSRNVVFKLSSLFALDAFAGGLLVQSLMAYWLHVRFGVESGDGIHVDILSDIRGVNDLGQTQQPGVFQVIFQ